MTRVLSILLGCVLALGGSLATAQPEEEVSSLSELLQRFRGIEGLGARFVEEKHISLLSAPLRTKGTLHYDREHEALARHTTRPSKSSVVVVDGEVRFGDTRSSRSVQVDRNPVARALVTTFLHVLRGDGKALEREFEVKFEPASDERGWRLTMAPRDAAVRRIFRRMRLEGRGARLTSLAILESNGDRTEMRFEGVDLERRYGEAERERVFSLGHR
ncbi:MAG: LolA family protein [Myxococcota bacterium]